MPFPSRRETHSECHPARNSSYPDARKTKDDPPKGVAGKLVSLASSPVAEQPVMSFDWNDQKEGVCVFASFDQTVRVAMVTKLGDL